jgi:hypothetical protein
MTINEERQLGLAKSATLTFFETRTAIPKIYIDADWNGQHVDVLAIDRDGIGDVHAVLLFLRQYTKDGLLDQDAEFRMVDELIDRFSSIPANYKYIAAVDINREHPIPHFRVLGSLLEKLFSPNFIGRIGLLHITAVGDETPETFYRLGAQRFRATIAKLADDYVQHHEADWEIRA